MLQIQARLPVVLFRAWTHVLPPHTQIQRQTRPPLEIVWEERRYRAVTIVVRKGIAGDDGLNRHSQEEGGEWVPAWASRSLSIPRIGWPRGEDINPATSLQIAIPGRDHARLHKPEVYAGRDDVAT